MDLVAQTVVRNVELTHGDARVRIAGARAVIVNRLHADNLQVVDPSARFATVAQWSVGPGANPADVALAATEALLAVPLYDRPEVALFDARNGEEAGAISLSEQADADGLPEPAGAARAPDGRLLVPLQRLDRARGYAPTGPAVLAALDVGARAVVATAQLRVENPIEPPEVVDLPGGGPSLVLVGIGSYFAIDGGGVERVSALPPYDSTWIVGEAELGGSPTDVATADGQTWWIVVSRARADAGADGFAQDTVLVRHAAATGEREEVLATDGFHIADIAIGALPGRPAPVLLVADRTPERPGVRIYDAATSAELTAAPIDTGLPPLRVAPLGPSPSPSPSPGPHSP